MGLLLYGYKPFESGKLDLTPVMKVYAPIILERNIKKGESALYGNLPAIKAQKISLVRYGYADGLFRLAVDGQFNNRCMDITALNNINKEKGYALIMGDADKTAKLYKTISYEVLVKCSLRAEKIYLR